MTVSIQWCGLTPRRCPTLPRMQIVFGERDDNGEWSQITNYLRSPDRHAQPAFPPATQTKPAGGSVHMNETARWCVSSLYGALCMCIFLYVCLYVYMCVFVCMFVVAWITWSGMPVYPR